jgi:hypothetical protein
MYGAISSALTGQPLCSTHGRCSKSIGRKGMIQPGPQMAAEP